MCVCASNSLYIRAKVTTPGVPLALNVRYFSMYAARAVGIYAKHGKS